MSTSDIIMPCSGMNGSRLGRLGGTLILYFTETSDPAASVPAPSVSATFDPAPLIPAASAQVPLPQLTVYAGDTASQG
jgi:hypothetical protein